MGSKILYNMETNEILRCQRKPFGSAGMPSFKAICMSASVPENLKSKLDTCVINERISTKEAKTKLRIVNGEAINKPKVNITTDKQEVSISDNPQFNIDIQITNQINTDSFSTVQMSINDVEFTINITDNIGTKTIELSEADAYKISCIDDRFISQQVEVIAVE